MAEAKSHLTDTNYLVIQGWMITELGLKGNELLIYALIYGFSQTEDQWFTGTLKYIAEWTNSTVRGVQKSIASLLGKELIEKVETTEKGTKSCKYRVWNKVHGGMEQSSWGYGTKFMRGMEQSSPNNININNTPFKHNLTTFDYVCSPQGENTPKKRDNPKGKKQFIPPTLEEVTAYCASRGNKVDPNRFYDYYEAADWRDSEGKKVRSWKQKCITWERKSNEGAASGAKMGNSRSDAEFDDFWQAALNRAYADAQKNKTGE